MSRTAHRYEPGVWHHITVTTATRQPLFTDAARVRILQGRLNAARRRFALLCIGYVIMPDHFHWVIYPTEPGFEDFAAEQIQKGGRYADDPAAYYLPRIVEEVKRGTTQAIRRLARSLPQQIWQPGFWDRPVQDMRRLPDILRYIHMNPVRAGLCSRPADYPYSSHNAMVYDHPHAVVLDRMIWEQLGIPSANRRV